MKISFEFPSPESIEDHADLARVVFAALSDIRHAVNDVDYDQASFARHSVARRVTNTSGRVTLLYGVEFDRQPDVLVSFEDSGANARGVKVRSHSGAKPPWTGVVVQLYNPGTGAEIATGGVPVTVSVMPHREPTTSAT